MRNPEAETYVRTQQPRHQGYRAPNEGLSGTQGFASSTGTGLARNRKTAQTFKHSCGAVHGAASAC
eukprot:531650-Lingulodinium_polyedra.AAC.1